MELAARLMNENLDAWTVIAYPPAGERDLGDQAIDVRSAEDVLRPTARGARGCTRRARDRPHSRPWARHRPDRGAPAGLALDHRPEHDALGPEPLRQPPDRGGVHHSGLPPDGGNAPGDARGRGRGCAGGGNPASVQRRPDRRGDGRKRRGLPAAASKPTRARAASASSRSSRAPGSVRASSSSTTRSSTRTRPPTSAYGMAYTAPVEGADALDAEAQLEAGINQVDRPCRLPDRRGGRGDHGDLSEW